MSRWIREADLASYPTISEQEVDQALALGTAQVYRNLPEFTDAFPGPNSINGFYQAGPNRGWTTGFWTGEIWLAYEYAQSSGRASESKETETAGQADAEDAALAKVPSKAAEPAGESGSGKCNMAEAFRAAAEQQVASFLHRIECKEDVDHHDMGFLYSPSCVAAYILTGNEDAKRAAILAADQLISRFQPVGGFIQAWGAMGERENYRFIIDCLLNIPLLYWASRETEDPKYRDVAERHIHTAMANVIRDDDSTWHTVFMDPVTGKFDHGATCQGYKDGSAWARGQAWGVYGTAVAYKNTKQEEYKGYFRRVTTYFLNHLPKDLIPYWDLTFGDGDGSALTDGDGSALSRNAQTAAGAKRYTFGDIPGEEPRDSSSAVIAACGMLEMAKYLDEQEAAYYTDIAKKLLKACYDTCFVEDPARSNGILLHGTYSHKSPYNTCTPEGTNECVLWGDYYFLEALTRLRNPDWKLYW